VGVRPEQVAVGGGASPLVGLVAGSLPETTRVLAPDVEFSSLLWPWVTRGADVRVAPLARLAEAVDERTDLVAVSAAQSATGEVADLDAICEAAAARGALVVVDATHGCGWLPLDATRFDALVCSAYKWLLSPRGTAFLALGERLRERVRPLAANWYAAGGAHGAYYGLEMPLPETAARLDLSPRLVLLGRHGAGARGPARDRDRPDPRARPRAREPFPRGSRPRAVELGDRHGRGRGRGGEAAARRHPRSDPGRLAPSLLPRLQHGSR